MCQVRWATVSRSTQPYDLLDERERQRATRFRRDEQRSSFVAARGLAKQVVAERAGIAPRDVRILTSCRRCGSHDHGKPRAEHPGGTTALSISHSGRIVMVAISDGPDVGVDVEHADPERWSPRLSRLIESRSAPESIGSAPMFFTIWTCKEAILKCTGDGLLADMRSLSLRIGDADGSPEVRFVDGPWRPRRALSVHTVPIVEHYAAALAIASDGDVALDVRRA